MMKRTFVFFAPNDSKSGAANSNAPKQQQTEATAATPAPVASAAPAPEAHNGMRVKFMAPSYPGKDLTKTRNVADAILSGAFPGMRLQISGITLALNVKSGEMTVYLPKAGPFSNSPRAIGPEMIPAPPGVDTPDGLVLAAGARGAAERFEQAVRDAWAAANVTGQTKWGVEIPLGTGQ